MLRICYLLSLLLCTCGPALQAQALDAKINLGSLFTGGINVSADYSLNERLSVAAGLAYSSTGFSINDGEYRYRTARLIPELRYYVAPMAGADRFFVGGYSKLGRVTAIRTNSGSRSSGGRGVLGILTGYKWATRAGVVVELNAGLGRAIVLSDDQVFDRAISFVSATDLRLGILVGYRFQ